MFDSLIVNVAIALIFAFGVFALITSTLTEAIARFLGLRGDFLLRGLRALVDGTSVKASSPAASGSEPSGPDSPSPVSARLLDTMLLANQGQESILHSTAAGVKSLAARRRLPSYLPARSFAAAVLDLLIPGAATGTTSMTAVVSAIRGYPAVPFGNSLLALAKDANGDIDRFRTNIEHWYDDHMDRVSGWYKRHVRWISLGIGTVLVLALNVNAVTLARTLYTDQALNESVVTQAIAHTQCNPDSAGACIADAQKQLSDLRGDGLPLGWGIIPQCRAIAAKCAGPSKYGLANPDHNGSADYWYILALIVGWIITALALTPGARFWFDLLGRLGSLRSSGPKPAKT